MSATTAAAEAARREGVRVVLACEAKRILVAGGRVAGVATDAGVLRLRPGRRRDRAAAALPAPQRGRRPAGLLVTRLAPRDGEGRSARLRTRSSRRPGLSRRRWGRLVGDPTLGDVAAGRADDGAFVSLLLGGRPAGHCVIGTSLGAFAPRGARGRRTPCAASPERAVRVAPHLEGVPVVASWSGRRALTPDGLPVVGPAGDVAGLDVIGGLSSIGMVTAPGLARRLAAGDPGPFAAERIA